MVKSENSCITPPRLKPGDLIGVAAPASPFNASLFEAGLDVIENMGFRVHVPAPVFKKSGYYAGSDLERAGVLNRLFADPKIKGIICARGGFGSMKTLPFLDYAGVGKNPKAIVGFSDVSALLSVLEARCGLVTFHGPMVTTLGRAPLETRRAFVTSLTGNERISMHARNGVCLSPGTAEGPVIGGNLATLCHLVGTPFEPTFADKILLLEDCGEACYRIDRMLTQMKMAGCFNGVAGIALGRFFECGDEKEIYRIVKGVFKGDDIPIMAGFDVGHGDCNMMVPLGLEAVMDTTEGIIRFTRPATSTRNE